MKDVIPLELPSSVGTAAAGVVDEVGDGVATAAAAGDEVSGLAATGGFAQHVVLDAWAGKPAARTWEQADGAGPAVETATRALDLLGVDRAAPC